MLLFFGGRQLTLLKDRSIKFSSSSKDEQSGVKISLTLPETLSSITIGDLATSLFIVTLRF